MTKNNKRISRVKVGDWNFNSNSFMSYLMILGHFILWIPPFLWKSYLATSMTSAIFIAQKNTGGNNLNIWLHKGHIWLAYTDQTKLNIEIKAKKTKPRYNAKEQWWWGFVDPSIAGIMENMDRNILGLKQKHDNWWKSLQSKKKISLKRESSGISVRDNRYIPQWVKIEVVLRDQGRCVYCGETDAKLLEFDHKKAWSKGGSSKDPFNICLGCKPCNRQKSDKDWGWG